MLARPILVLQHGEDGPPGRLGEWLRERGLEFVVHPVHEQAPPDPREYAAVVSLGSEHAADETGGWVPSEIEALHEAVEAEVPVLGLCFGGQALSLVLGGGLDRLASPEIGWCPVESFDPLVPAGHWLQYHYDQLRLPPGARELARSRAGPAAFLAGPHLGVQFHPEVDGGIVDLWAHMDHDLPSLGITPEQLAAQSAEHAGPARARAWQLFDRWLAHARAGAAVSA